MFPGGVGAVKRRRLHSAERERESAHRFASVPCAQQIIRSRSLHHRTIKANTASPLRFQPQAFLPHHLLFPSPLNPKHPISITRTVNANQARSNSSTYPSKPHAATPPRRLANYRIRRRTIMERSLLKGAYLDTPDNVTSLRTPPNYGLGKV